MKKLAVLFLAIIVLSCTKQAPLVGVTCSRYSTTNLLPTTYTDAITRAGGIAVVLPTVDSPERAAQLLSRLDGILFSGGEDVSPQMYGEDVLNETVEVDTLRDRSDSLLARAALAAGKPILAICRGSQLMNVLLGGSLYQDIPTQIPGNVGHGATRHNIGLEQGSVLSRLYGTDSLNVNSYHHQCVKALGKGITVTARSADGIVEAWEAPGIWAVQFHPEKELAAGNDAWLPFFREWVESL